MTGTKNHGIMPIYWVIQTLGSATGPAPDGSKGLRGHISDAVVAANGLFCSEELIVAVAEVNQRRCLEESGQWLENIDGSNLVLASGKLVHQKSYPAVYTSE